MTRLNCARRSPALLGVAASLLMGATLAACSTEPPAPAASQSAAAADKDDAPANKKGKRTKGKEVTSKGLKGMKGRLGTTGADALFDAALSELELSDEQRSNIEALEKESRPEGKRTDDRQALMKVLADGVKKGAVDEKAAQAELDKERTAREADQAKTDAALDKLHGLLDEGQRKQVSESLLAKMENHGGPRDRRPGPDTARRVDLILRGVQVTPEKHKALEEALVKAKLGTNPAENDMDAAIARKRATIEAFAKPDFRAASSHTQLEKNIKLTDMIQTLAVIAPLLDEAQRGELAERLEKGKGRRDPDGEKKREKVGAAPPTPEGAQH